jgi:protein TonB
MKIKWMALLCWLIISHTASSQSAPQPPRITDTSHTAAIFIDTIVANPSTQAQFKGGHKAWIHYLNINLNAGVPRNNNAPHGFYRVVVGFIIASNGSLTDLIAETKLGYGMEKEVMRLLKKSPPWIPATLNGIAVRSYKSQAVIFGVW